MKRLRRRAGGSSGDENRRMADTTAITAILIAIISLSISILNYYKSLEPASSIRIEVEKRKQYAALYPDYIKKIFFKNDSNNKFNDLDISITLISGKKISMALQKILSKMT